jgi:hypothetical protein
MSAAAVLLVAWHGLLLSLPHEHHGERLQIDVARCSATAPTSSEVHLHRAVRELPRTFCLACLVASTLAALESSQVHLETSVAPAPTLEPVREHHTGGVTRLPQWRAPPSYV